MVSSQGMSQTGRIEHRTPADVAAETVDWKRLSCQTGENMVQYSKGNDGEIIRCTETHPFQVKDKGWVDAAELVPGDLVYRKNWHISPVQRVTIIALSEPVEVFNFEVEDCHTYFVGNLGILVHNACTKYNYRSNAKKYYNTDGVGQEAHHLFPQKYESFFASKGMNIHAPQNIKFMQTAGHRTNSYAYNRLWEQFITENSNASIKSIQIASEYFMKMVFG